jgi:DNA-binding IclR family transcriptional regulator
MSVYEYLCKCFDEGRDPNQAEVAQALQLTPKELRLALAGLREQGWLYGNSMIPTSRVATLGERDG